MREALIDTQAITDNVRHLKHLAGVPEFIAVVKADGYGHGAVRAAQAAVRGGATRIGVADIQEALSLVRAGVCDVPVLAWLHQPEQRFEDAVRAGIEIGVSSHPQLEAAATAAGDGSRARVHIKLETGLGRGGASPADWPSLFTRAREHQVAGRIQVVGLFSHLSGASRHDDLAQVEQFEQGIDIALLTQLDPPLLHLAATAATISLPEARFNTVRVGIGIYGLSPFSDRSSHDLGLRPAMTLRAPVAAVRRVQAGQGVSYDYTYRAPKETTLALIPLGYADGIPRQASGVGRVAINGHSYRTAGRIAMDQFVIDIGDNPVEVGDIATIFGDAREGVPSVDDWAAAANTINYDILVKIGARVTRSTSLAKTVVEEIVPTHVATAPSVTAKCSR